MTIAWSPLTVATSIAGLTITGVTIKDVTSIPSDTDLTGPIIFPQPNGFISNVEPDSVSLGSMGAEAKNMLYTLNYVFLFTPIGGGVGAFAPYGPLVTLLTAIINVILNNDVVSGLVDMELSAIDGIGVVQDPNEVEYWGALFSLRCLEYAK